MDEILDVVIFILKWLFVGILIAVGCSIGSGLISWLKRQIEDYRAGQQLPHTLKALGDEMDFQREVLPKIREWIEQNPGVDEKETREKILDALQNAGWTQKAEELRRHWEKS